MPQASRPPTQAITTLAPGRRSAPLAGREDQAPIAGREDQAPIAARPSTGSSTTPPATSPTALPTPTATASIPVPAPREQAHAKRPSPTSGQTSTTQALTPQRDTTWPSGQEITLTQAAQGTTPRGKDVVVIDVPNPAQLSTAAITAATKSDGQLVWSLPVTTTWRSVMPQLTKAGPAPIIRLTGDASTRDVADAARQIKTAARKARVEWVVPAGALPTDVTNATAAAAVVDVIGLTIGPGDTPDPWPATKRRLDAWTTWAAQHRKRVAIMHHVDGDTTWPSYVRAVNEWTATQAKHKRIAYTSAHITGNTTSLAARKARGQA